MFLNRKTGPAAIAAGFLAPDGREGRPGDRGLWPVFNETCVFCKNAGTFSGVFPSDRVKTAGDINGRNYESKTGKMKGGAADGNGKMAESSASRFRYRHDGLRNHQDRKCTVMD